MSIAAIILAAGASSRMRGADKLTMQIGGEALLRRTARIALVSKASPVIAVLGAHAEDRRAALAGLDMQVTIAPDWQSGMAHSIAAGIRQLPGQTRGALIVLSDMPALTSDLLDLLIAKFPDDPSAMLRPSNAGLPGHPVLFGAAYFPALMRATGEDGARAVLRANREHLRVIESTDQGAFTDLDTPEAWAHWRSRTLS